MSKELKYCQICIQMTIHKDNVCQKCLIPPILKEMVGLEPAFMKEARELNKKIQSSGTIC